MAVRGGINKSVHAMSITSGGRKATDRRHWTRFRTKTRINLQLMGQAPAKGGALFGFVINKSEGGLRLLLDVPLRKRQILRLFVPFLNKKTRVPTLGEVRWVKKRNPNGDYVVGVDYIL